MQRCFEPDAFQVVRCFGRLDDGFPFITDFAGRLNVPRGPCRVSLSDASVVDCTNVVLDFPGARHWDTTAESGSGQNP